MRIIDIIEGDVIPFRPRSREPTPKMIGKHVHVWSVVAPDRVVKAAIDYPSAEYMALHTSVEEGVPMTILGRFGPPGARHQFSRKTLLNFVNMWVLGPWS